MHSSGVDNVIATLIQRLREKGAPLAAIETLAALPGPNQSETQTEREKEAG